MIWFVLGFATRATIGFIDRLHTAWKRQRSMFGGFAMDEYQWLVELNEIKWDNGKGEYDVSDLPKQLALHVAAAFDADEAIELAMSDASDDYGALIEGCTARASRIE
jgi:hypothetical protein